jgi:tripartite-type tricarboxylate transporter receptor subunit TctC
LKDNIAYSEAGFERAREGNAMRTSFFRRGWGIYFGAIFFCHVFLLCSAWGLEYPTKPINLVVAATAGGPSDVHARILAEAASKELGVPFVIINKAGPGGALAASYVANEKPDGYTFLVTQSSTMTSNFSLFPNLSYKRTDFFPLFMSIVVPVNIAVKSDSPYRTLRDFLEAAKKQPGKLKSGSASPGITLVWKGLLKREGIDITHMLYKGAPDSLLAVLGGHIDCNCDALTPMVPHVEAGKLRLLASISSKRNKYHPDVLTLRELGYSDFSKDFWNGFFAPAGIPQEIVEKIVPVFHRAASLPHVQGQLEKAGVFTNFLAPKEFAALIDEELSFYAALAKENK